MQTHLLDQAKGKAIATQMYKLVLTVWKCGTGAIESARELGKYAIVCR